VKPGFKVIADGNDGVVAYQSAHIDEAKSELVVRWNHSCQGQPEAIEEVRRILLEHAAAHSEGAHVEATPLAATPQATHRKAARRKATR